MVTVLAPVLPTVTWAGNKDGLTFKVKVSSSSRVLSSVIGTSNDTLVSPARNVAVYGPAV